MSTITAAASATIRENMPVADRLALIQRVLAKAYEEIETWNDDHVGSALAYLALAIADGKIDSNVDWSDENGNKDTAVVRAHFREWFTDEDPVWAFILA